MTHRDVAKVLPSVCALVRHARRRAVRPISTRRPSAPTTPTVWRTGARAADRLPRRAATRTASSTCSSTTCSAIRSARSSDALRRARRRAHRRGPPADGRLVGRRAPAGPLRARRATRSDEFGLDPPVASPSEFAFYTDRFDVPVTTGPTLEETTMDEITQKVVDGTAWREFCDLLADAGEVDPRRGQPRRPARSGRGLPDAHPPAARRARDASSSTAGRPSPCWSAPATRRSRSSARTRTTTTSAPRSTGSTTTGSGAPAATRSGSASTCSPAPASAAAGPGTGATLHEEQMHIEPDGTFELVISQREHPGNWLRSEPDTRSLAIRQTFLDRPNQRARRAAHRAHRRRRRHRPQPLTAEELYLVAALRRLLREGRRRDRRAVGDPPGAVAQRVHRRGRGRPRPTSSRTRRSSGTRPTSTSADDEALVVEVTPPDVRVLDDRPAQPLDGDARLRPPPGDAELPHRPSSNPTAASAS